MICATSTIRRHTYSCPFPSVVEAFNTRYQKIRGWLCSSTITGLPLTLLLFEYVALGNSFGFTQQILLRRSCQHSRLFPNCCSEMDKSWGGEATICQGDTAIPHMQYSTVQQSTNISMPIPLCDWTCTTQPHLAAAKQIAPEIVLFNHRIMR